MDYYSPLRYPGGKRQLSTFFKQLYRENNLYDSTYVEPYAGGASIALTLLFNEYASKIIINDLDKSVYSFWYSVLNHTEELCKIIKDTRVNIKTWHEQIKIQKHLKPDKLALGFSTFFLNRTNRSGIINAGVIGGLDQTGNYLIDARFKKDILIKKINKIAMFKDRIELHNLDAVKLLHKIINNKMQNVFIYLDPPYYEKGKDLYLNYYKEKDHREIYKAVTGIKEYKWLLTYDNVPFIYSLYSDYRKIKFALNYSASRIYRGIEVAIFSNKLKIPNNLELRTLEVAA